jgi:hypothetical protein
MNMAIKVVFRVLPTKDAERRDESARRRRVLHGAQGLFPHFCDIKHIAAVTEPGATDGLSDVTNGMGVSRLGTAHQAGSDAFVTFLCF